MNYFKRWNIIIGWIIFLIAAIVYILTIEPSVSYWDCGEFITSAFKLEVGHPPGAPLFTLIAKIFSLFAADNTKVAICINTMSALASAFTVMFLFWTITWFAQKIVSPNIEITKFNVFSIIAAGAIGSMVFAFSDSFWFSAVEAEVYATSSLFTAIIFWCILRWENDFHNPHSNKWLILIAFLTGLSIGVHILNLLVIPAVCLVFYFKRYRITWWGILLSILISFLLLEFVKFCVITGLLKISGIVELFCINKMGMPFNSGIIIFLLLIIIFLIGGIYLSLHKNWSIINTLLLALSMLIVGFSSYATIIIRANANPPMNENCPDNIFGLISYLDREQYGETPLLYGPYYNAPILKTIDGKPVYCKKDNNYVVSYYKPKYVYDNRYLTFFPRMFSTESSHVNIYKSWGDITGKKIIGEVEPGEYYAKVPTFNENLRFFFKYQVVYMYCRYFGWNFIGRQNNIDGDGGILHGNWISGINFIDSYFYGSQKLLPKFLKNNKGRNKYFFLPFLLGLAGIYYQIKKDWKNSVILLFLFFMTGLAIVIYLNQEPLQPRERDYAYVGSFYAFSIWIGLGFLGIRNFILKYWSNKYISCLIFIALMLLLPVLMANQNWDDHNRSNRYTTHDVAYNSLNSCAPNSILFTSGDNDTFPLWYLQEVEGVRTDVRVVNILLLDFEWYIDQMKRKVYTSDSLPISISHNRYKQGSLDYVYMVDKLTDTIQLSEIIRRIKSENIADKLKLGTGEIIDYVPTKNFNYLISKDEVIENNTVNSNIKNNIVPNILFHLKAGYLSKNEIINLDLILNNHWKRPIYHIAPNGGAMLGFGNYLQLDGFAYRFIPIYTPKVGYFRPGRLESSQLYNKYMKTFKWGNMNDSKVLIDDLNIQTAALLRIRMNFARLAEQLSLERKKRESIEVIQKCYELMPYNLYPHDYYSLKLIEVAYKTGATGLANKMLNEYAQQNIQEMVFFRSLPKRLSQLINDECVLSYQTLVELTDIAGKNDQKILKQRILSQIKEQNLSR